MFYTGIDVIVYVSYRNWCNCVCFIQVEATHAYKSEDDDELSFDVGEYIYVIEYEDPEEQVYFFISYQFRFCPVCPNRWYCSIKCTPSACLMIILCDIHRNH